MIYTDEPDLEDVPSAGAELMAEYATFTEEMVRRGVIRGGDRLRPTWAATTVQVRDGDVMISDGPFAETKQQIESCLIECAGLDEALEVAAKIPSARQGTIEVRPIWET